MTAKSPTHRESAARVRAIRKKTGLSQGKFCKKYGIETRTLQKWEQAVTLPNYQGNKKLELVEASA